MKTVNTAFKFTGMALLIIACINIAHSETPFDKDKNHVWSQVPQKTPSTDHGTFFEETFSDGPSVTRACLKCHENSAKEVMKTAHWNLVGEEVLVPGHDQPMRIGKRNVINNFCIGISSNWSGCTTCHIGYGWENENFDLNNPYLVDCLVCHDTTGTYLKEKGGAGRPDPKVDLLAVAKAVGRPSRTNCGTCHFQGGGGNAIKHGDLDETLLFPSARIDIHMGKLDFQCVDCHQAKEHSLPGRLLTVSVDRKNRLRCTRCHQEEPHEDIRLNVHTGRIACQTCHIPYMAVDSGTKLTWDWSQAGQDLGITDEHIYLKIKGRFTYAKGIKPEYYWYNETSSRYILGDRIDPDKPTQIAAPIGDRQDPTSKIYPFKVHRGKQIYDVMNRYFILPHVHGDKGFWTKFDWPTAAKIGAESTGLDFSGLYDFAPTEMFIPQNHMVSPSAKALTCPECHGERGRLDWAALGYESDPLIHPVLEHESFTLLDADEEPVQYSATPVSTRATCGQCHDVFTDEFNASHGYHNSIDPADLPPERRLLLTQGPGIPADPSGEMNCFLCHMKEPSHFERVYALNNGLEEWSISATLEKTNLIERTKTGYLWNEEALEEDIDPGTNYVREANCGNCHGLVQTDNSPLLVDIGTGNSWTTEKTGQIFSSQQIRHSGMNIRNKDELNQAWDVHAERLVQCGDCHYSKGRPERLAGEIGEHANPKPGELRRRCESCHSLADTHNWLPEKARHMTAVSCESCHVPKLYMAAQELVDRTVIHQDGSPKIIYRGVSGGKITTPATTYIEGYRPLLLIGKSVDGRDQVIPYNLVSEWFWANGVNGKEIPDKVMRAAWIDEGEYHNDILKMFDENGDGTLDDDELLLNSSEKQEMIRHRLIIAGADQPEIRAEIRGYHIHHNVTHGSLVNRECNNCHEQEEKQKSGFEVSPYLPGGILPENSLKSGPALDGHLTSSPDGALRFVRKRAIADTYQELVGKTK